MQIRIQILLLAAAALCAPYTGAVSNQAGATQPLRLHATLMPDQRVDINHASVDELMKVPGLTRTWAGRIVRFRPYRSKQDLLDRGIVTSEVYDRIKDHLIAHRDKE